NIRLPRTIWAFGLAKRAGVPHNHKQTPGPASTPELLHCEPEGPRLGPTAIEHLQNEKSAVCVAGLPTLVLRSHSRTCWCDRTTRSLIRACGPDSCSYQVTRLPQ